MKDSRSQTNTCLNANKHWLGELNIFEEEEKEIVRRSGKLVRKVLDNNPLLLMKKSLITISTV